MNVSLPAIIAVILTVIGLWSVYWIRKEFHYATALKATQDAVMLHEYKEAHRRIKSALAILIIANVLWIIVYILK